MVLSVSELNRRDNSELFRSMSTCSRYSILSMVSKNRIGSIYAEHYARVTRLTESEVVPHFIFDELMFLSDEVIIDQ